MKALYGNININKLSIRSWIAVNEQYSTQLVGRSYYYTVSDYLGAVRILQKVDQRASVVGRGVRSPCSDSDESDDDVLSVGPMRPLLIAAPLGGAIGHDDYMIQDDPLHEEWSVYSGTVEDRYGTSCAQLDNFDWVMQADYPVGVLPESEDDSLLDIEPDVCDTPNIFPVGKETVAVESLCCPVVVTTRPQGGCDPVLPLSKGRGRKIVDPDVRRDIHMEPEIPPVVISTKAIVSGRVSKIIDPDVRCDIHIEPEILPVVISTEAIVIVLLNKPLNVIWTCLYL